MNFALFVGKLLTADLRKSGFCVETMMLYCNIVFRT